MTRTPASRRPSQPTDPDFDPSNWPFYQASRLVGLYNLRLDSVLKPIGMDVPRWRVLMVLSRVESATVTKLADEAVSRVPTMTKIIQRMAAQELVVTRPSTEDARVTEVLITSSGRDVLERVRLKVGFISDQAFYGLSSKELDSFTRLAAKIYHNLV
ncbi:MarR family winged helix-turn-helix transcriptional regulator [Acidocella sp.]|uniref:MarR family winged helix-turn-helix transcriptional regulator n=1 Tax=Acidocella sp. TaxID=50710 RepID=UPI003D02F326